jgi:hypothetical protein
VREVRRGEVVVRLEDDPAVFEAPFVQIEVGGPEGNTVTLEPDAARWAALVGLPAVLPPLPGADRG